MSEALLLPVDADRVRRHTCPRTQREIDLRTLANIERFRGRPRADIERRLADLEREWDVERVLETNASSLALAGLALAVAVHRRWLWLSGAVLGFLFLHGVQGWCPPLPVLRRLGVRTRAEIDREKYALWRLLHA